MSSRPAIIALILTVLLAMVTWLVIKPPAQPTLTGPAAGQRVLQIDPATITTITITIATGNGPTQALDRLPTGRWNWRPSEKATPAYPLDDTRIRAFLRLLAELKAVASAPAGTTTLPDSPPPVTLTLSHPGGPTTLQMAPRALGGQVLSQVVTPTQSALTILSEEILTLVTSPGPSAWRDTRPLAGLAASASRIRFTDASGTKGFGLSRRGGQWTLTPPAPVTAPASIDAVSAVLSTIDTLTITRFFDAEAQPGLPATGLSTPTATLTIERDEPSLDAGPPKTVSLTLVTGQPADTAGTSLYASLDGGATVFAVAAVPLTRLTANPATLVSPTAARTLAIDVGGLRISTPSGRTVTLQRDTSSTSPRWTEAVDGQDPITLDPTRAAASGELIGLLTTVGADEVTFDPPAGTLPAGTFTLLSPSGNPLEVLDILQAPGKGHVVLRTGPPGSATTAASVYRTYTKPPAELGHWLARLR